MRSSTEGLRLWRGRGQDIGLGRAAAKSITLGDRLAEHASTVSGDILVAALDTRPGPQYLLAAVDTVLGGATLTSFLARVAPFGCPAPPSLIRAYSLPDAPFPSILIKEHEEAHEDIGDAYRRFAARARQGWLAALQESGPGLCPALAWQAGPDRRFLTLDAWTSALAEAGVALPGVSDDYLGRGLLVLAHPELAASWPTMMSLGGPTKSRRITGREFPVWIDLAAHQPALLGSPILMGVEGRFAAT